MENKSRKFENKAKDLQDELDANKNQIEIMENKSKNSSKLISSNNSEDELASVNSISCKSCGLTFQNEKELKVHKEEDHKMQFFQKIKELDRQISCQRSSLISSLLKLKEKDFKSKQTCSCKGFCKITHLKHNYFKSKADELCEKMQKISIKNEKHLHHLGALNKCFKCGFCDENSTKKSHLKKSKKSAHTKQQTEKLTNDLSSKPKKIKSKNIKIQKTPKGRNKAKVQVFVDKDIERHIDDAKFLCESTDDHTSYGEESVSRSFSSILSSDQSFSGTKNGEI